MKVDKWNVLKFGGTSVSNRKNWENISKIIKNKLDSNKKVLIVCSAISGVSNLLDKAFTQASSKKNFYETLSKIFKLHNDLTNSLNIKNLDNLKHDFRKLENLLIEIHTNGIKLASYKAQVMAFGELMSTKIGKKWLESQNINLIWKDSRDYLKAIENENAVQSQKFLSSSCHYKFNEEIKNNLGKEVEFGIITQGFIAKNKDNETVLLGRGGSDTSASYFASLIKAEKIEIWTDVPGLFTTNPRLVPTAKIIKNVDYDEAEAIAVSGAKVLHPRCIKPIRENNISMSVNCTSMPLVIGTSINYSNDNFKGYVKSISSRADICLLNIKRIKKVSDYEFISKVAKTFESFAIPFDSMVINNNNIQSIIDLTTFPLDENELSRFITKLNEFSKTKLDTQVGAVSLIGKNICRVASQLENFLKPLENIPIKALICSPDDMCVTLVVENNEAIKLVKVFHELYFSNTGCEENLGFTWEEFNKLKNDNSKIVYPKAS